MSDRRFADEKAGERIANLRRKAGLSQEKLSSLSKVSLDTVKRIESGKQLPRMSTISKLVPPLKTTPQAVIDAAQNEETKYGNSPSSIRVFTDWKESAEQIAGAKNSIVVIDSILFLDLEWMTNLVARAAQTAKADFEFSIYMASSRKEFGAQRSREMGMLGDGSKIIPFYESKISRAELKGYDSVFKNVELRIRQQLGEVPVTIFEYLCMPSIRIVAIDNARFVFGFFPLLNTNPNFPCFFLDKECATGTDTVLLERLANQIKNTRMVSILRDPAKGINPKAIGKGKT